MFQNGSFSTTALFHINKFVSFKRVQEFVPSLIKFLLNQAQNDR